MVTLVKMSPRLKISSYVIERLSKIDTNVSTGCLYGLMYDGTLLVVGLSIELFENEKNTYSQLLLNLPAEIELCGVVKFSDSLTMGTSVKEILQNVDITDNPLVMIVNEKKDMKTHFLVHDKFEETKYEVLSSDELWTQFLHVRLDTVLPLSCEATISGVKNIMQNKRKKIASGQVSFHINGTQVYLFGVASDVGLTGTSTEGTIGELVDSMNPEQSTKKKKQTVNIEIVPVNLVLKTTKDMLSDKLVKTAVKMMTTQRNPAYCISMPLRIDSLAIIHRNTKLLELYTVMVEAACRSLRLLESVLIEQLGQEGIGDGAGLRLPETYHFLPQEIGHFITRIVPKGIPDESMEKERRVLHEQLGLSLNRPVFRRGNTYLTVNDGRLINPHEAIPQPPSKMDVTTSLVRGRYAYYHYMQDNFNDDGWGCAYRSMQTIFSWFRFQGYTTVEVPSLRDIQQCLVKIGDKQSSFLGSKQWIGSTEVMFCLETLLGVQSRIIFANTGKDMQNYIHELIHHFQTHGSPIMIGGGVLAHTILGVEHNSATNEIRYLILDPHYTGAEDLTTVINKGWCGWKNSDFWNKTVHYNLCLPQTKYAI
ncbi:ufm1-specific protease 2 [Manduca sexta]|uniref:ufm1-specific protease 2 n=1 Tax=Manduca sexta TaxID=7130 RepID=UPI00188F80B6|nr:ufm1-specific protease 2 [Manduca sexta]